jgi:F-type H+-transporting ATPase subunit alpha
VRPLEEALYKFVEGRYPGVFKDIAEKREITDAIRGALDKAIQECKAEFTARAKA